MEFRHEVLKHGQTRDSALHVRPKLTGNSVVLVGLLEESRSTLLLSLPLENEYRCWGVFFFAPFASGLPTMEGGEQHCTHWP